MPSETIEDNLFADYEEDEPDPKPSKNPVAEQRKHIKDLEAKLKTAEPELEELRAFKTKYDQDQREAAIGATFTELGMPANAAKFFKLENPEGEVTKEKVAAWAVENQFATSDQFSDAGKSDEGFVPTSHGEGFMPGVKKYTREEFNKLLSTGNPADQLEANKAVEQGRVDFARA